MEGWERASLFHTLGWNTFPIPDLTPLQKTDLTRCAENILLAREAHFPATIADLYEVKNGQSKMPDDLATAHRQNDEVLERIYKGRVFKNDTERLETLFEMYTKMTGGKNRLTKINESFMVKSYENKAKLKGVENDTL